MISVILNFVGWHKPEVSTPIITTRIFHFAVLAVIYVVLAGCWDTTADQTTLPGTIAVEITPTSVTMSPFTTQQFSATVTNSNNNAVTWQVDDIEGGNPNIGTISSTGLYTAPANAGTHVVKAVSVANTTQSGSAPVTVQSATPTITVKITPTTASLSPLQTQQFTAKVNNSSNQSVTWQVDDIEGGNPNIGTISSTGLYAAPADPGTHVVKAISTSDTTKSGNATITVSSNTAITVEVTPATATVATLLSQQFTATVSNSRDTNIIWEVDDIEGGNANVGTISASGLYTAPGDDGRHVIKAVSVVDATKSDSATVTVIELESVSGVFTYHNDNSRSGQNLKESILTPTNVNSQTFGKLFALPVDGYVYAQPLYISNVSIKGQTRNVLFVATEGNSVYAFDADKPGDPLWRVSFIDPSRGITTVPYQDTATPPGYTGPGPVIPGGCADLTPQIGITGTPVIDPVTGTLYVVAKTREASGSNVNYEFRIHALDVATGSSKSGSGKAIAVSVPGTTEPNDNNRVVFQSLRQNQRAALLLSNNILTIAFSSHCVIRPYQGWVLSYDAINLNLVSAFNVVPNDPKGKGGIWHSGGGPAADASGNVYVMTGDGPFDVNVGGDSYSDSVLKLQNGSLKPVDYFTPFNQTELENANADISAGGPLLLPNQSVGAQRIMFSMGKQGIAYLLNRDDMGKFQPGSDSQILQSFRWGTCGTGNCLVFGTPAYFNNNIYMAAVEDFLRAYSFVDGQLYPSSQSTNKFPWPGASPVVSANGTSNGIVWAIQTNGSGAPAILHAYSADFVSTRLYSSDENSARDNPGPAVKFSVPTVANGKVYVGSTSQVSVYGLLP